MTADVRSNPFHLEAVATYGQILRTCADLGYMQEPLGELDSYLRHYFPSARRYGGAIGLSGGHGSGKTHLLNWLAQETTSRQKVSPVVVYAKADHPSFFALYLQFMEFLSREKLQELISEGLHKTANAEVKKAAATEHLAEQLEQPGGLTQLAEEGSVDINQLLIVMNDKLNEQIVVSDIPRILLLVNSPSQGEKAYQWLLGKDVVNPETLGLRSGLVPPSPGTDDSSASDVIAINAMEAIAALMNLAERPFVVMVDQLEVLFQVDTASQTAGDMETADQRVDFSTRRKIRQQTTFSAIKKMIEQLGRQNALCFIAGNKQSWEILPRDVAPRMRLREPLPVGNLSEVETTNLINEYARGLPYSFSFDNIKDIHRLAGGNPREIIRIAYYAYEAVDGILSNVNEDVLVKSANKSGSVADRNKLALSMATNVLQKFGDAVLKDLDIGDGISIDLLVKDKDIPLVALVTLKATDKLSEVERAKRLNTIRAYLEKTWPRTSLICVTVGYSSTVVQNLLRETSTILQFDEDTFAGSLLTKVTELVAKQRSEPTTTSAGDPAVLKLLEDIAKRLNHLEVERVDQVKDVGERFAERTRKTAEPEREKRDLRTRWDLLTVVDDLQDALWSGEVHLERELMKSILIANESQLKLKQIDHIGGLYLDAIAEQENFYRNLGYGVDSTIDERFRREVSGYRKEIIDELKRILRGPRVSDRLMEHPWSFAVAGSAIVAAIYTLAIIFQRVVLGSGFYGSPSDYLLLMFIRYFLPVWFLSAVLLTLVTFYLRWRRFGRWDRGLKNMRRMTSEMHMRSMARLI